MNSTTGKESKNQRWIVRYYGDAKDPQPPLTGYEGLTVLSSVKLGAVVIDFVLTDVEVEWQDMRDLVKPKTMVFPHRCAFRRDYDHATFLNAIQLAEEEAKTYAVPATQAAPVKNLERMGFKFQLKAGGGASNTTKFPVQTVGKVAKQPSITINLPRDQDTESDGHDQELK